MMGRKYPTSRPANRRGKNADPRSLGCFLAVSKCNPQSQHSEYTQPQPPATTSVRNRPVFDDVLEQLGWVICGLCLRVRHDVRSGEQTKNPHANTERTHNLDNKVEYT